MTPPMRKQLRQAAEAAAVEDDPKSQALLDVFARLERQCVEPAGDKAKIYVLDPLRPLTGDPDNTPPSRYRFSPKWLGLLWSWLGGEVAQAEINQAKASREPPASSYWYTVRKEIAEKLEEALTKAERVPKDMTALTKRFGKGAKEWLGDVASLLRHSETMAEAMREYPADIREFDGPLAELTAERHAELEESSPDAARWLLILIMARMQSPWQIFRAVKIIGKRDDDLMVQSTHLAAAGDAVLEDVSYYAGRLKSPPGDLPEAKVLCETLERYVGYSVGMAREFGIRKDGRWGRKLFSMRANASSNLEKVLEKTPIALGSGLPEPIKGRGGRLVPAQLPDPAHIDRAEGLLFLLGASKEYADQAAVASLRNRLAEQCLDRLERAGSALLQLVKAETGQARIAASDGLEVTARLLEALGEGDLANSMRRRAAAAA